MSPQLRLLKLRDLPTGAPKPRSPEQADAAPAPRHSGGSADWSLDPSTRAAGRAGVAAARRALRASPTERLPRAS